MKTIPIHRCNLQFTPDSARVIVRPFIPDNPQRIIKILGRALAMSEKAAEREVAAILSDFGSRHINIEGLLFDIFTKVKPHADY